MSSDDANSPNPGVEVRAEYRAVPRWWPPFTHHITQLDQLAGNLAVAPIGVLARKTNDQYLDRLVRPRSTAYLDSSISPLPSYQLAVPFQHRFRLE